MTNDALIERVRKLLAKAEDPSVPEPEREALSNKAAELMLKHSIDEAMLNVESKSKKDIIKKRLKLDFIPAAYTYEYAVMGVNIAPFLNCRGVRAILPKRTDLFVIGHEDDLETMEMLYWSLIRQCMLSLTSWYKSFDTKRQLFGMTPQDKMKAKKSYVVGFIKGVCAKLETLRTQIIDEVGHGAEIVLADKRNAVDLWIDENMALTAGRVRSYALDGQSAGFQAGYDADIGQTSMGLNRRAIGSRP